MLISYKKELSKEKMEIGSISSECNVVMNDYCSKYLVQKIFPNYLTIPSKIEFNLISYIIIHNTNLDFIAIKNITFSILLYKA